MRRTAMVVLGGLILAISSGLALAGEDPSAGAVKWDESMTEPEAIDKVNPAYPEEARKEKVTGVVVLRAVIDTDGSVVDIDVLEDPDKRLTGAALAALWQWRFEPARDAEGNALSVRYAVTFKFALD